MSRHLAEADPSHAAWQRELSVSHHKVGDVLRAQGDPVRAPTAYGQALTVSRCVAEADPSNAAWQRDLSFALRRLAEFHERDSPT